MDGLSSAASVVAVIQLTGSIVKICGGYLHEVKDARIDIITLQRVVGSLEGIIQKLLEFLQGPHGTKLTSSSSLVNNVTDCLSDLGALEKKIDPGKGKEMMRRFGIRALKWPLKRTEVNRIIQDLERYKSSFTLSLQVDQASLLTGVARSADRIDQNLDLDKLPIARGAEFDSYMDQHEHECLPGTRTELIRQITEWARSPQGKCIFWLNGMAGTGKSTISRTVAKSFKEAKLLGASFFFKRGEGDRGSAMKLFSTITRYLVISIPQLVQGVQKALNDEPDIAGKSLKEQFNKLLLQPLLSLRSSSLRIPTAVIVIDALDECERDEDMAMIIQLLPQLRTSNVVRLRIFLTSRPELPIRLGFSKIANHEHEDLVLHKIPALVIEHDISLFLKHRLSAIRTNRSLPADWPGGTTIQALVKSSVPLFIFAATACRIVEDPQWDPVDSLTEILTHRNDGSQFDGTYLPVLSRIINGQSKKQERQLVRDFREIVGAIVMLESPLSITSLSNFLGISEGQIDRRLCSLHSVLSIPDDLTKPVRIFHISFRDYLVDPETRDKTPFWVDEKMMHQRLTARCLYVCDRLKKNICGLNHATKRAGIDCKTIDHYLPPELQYSCRYWAHHLVQSKDPIVEMKNAYLFLNRHFLHWMEAMSILGLASEVLGIINRLQLVLHMNRNLEFSDFLHDAKRFVLKTRQMADEFPLQIYCSGLLFTPTASVIRKQFERELPNWVRVLSNPQETWNAELQTLEGHSGPVLSVAFSPDGQLLASASQDKTVRLWDTGTGTLLHILEGHSSPVLSVAFSPSGQLLASASKDSTVRLWNATTGALQQILAGHSDWINSVAFSPGGQLLASASQDNTVRVWDTVTGALKQALEGRFATFSHDGCLIATTTYGRAAQLWDTATGALRQTFEGHSSPVRSVAFSPKGRLLASASHDRIVRLWDTTTGALQQTLEAHSVPVLSVAFSSNGRLLASASYDRTARLWDATTGALQQTLSGHSDQINSVAFSPEDRLLASASNDKTVRLWDTATGALQQAFEDHSSRILTSACNDKTIQLQSTAKGGLQHTLEGHSGPVYSVVLSPDGRLLASASADKTIKLWDMATGALRQTLEGHSGPVLSVAFSPDGRLLASVSADKTVRLWDTAKGTLRQTLDVGLSPFYSRNLLYSPTLGYTRWFSVNFSPDGRQMASVFGDTTVRLWDTATGALQQTLEGHSGLMFFVTFSPGGQLLASASQDNTVRVWDTDTGALRQNLEGHSDPVLSVAFSPDGRLLASASQDNTVRVWDTDTGALRQNLEGHSDPVLSVAFSPDGRLLASASRDQTVRLWDTATGNLQQNLQAKGAATKLEFCAGESYLTTNLGYLKFNSWYRKDTYRSPMVASKIFLQEGQWVTVRGQKALWLPLEYRPLSSAVKDKTLALGHSSGRISIIEFCDEHASTKLI